MNNGNIYVVWEDDNAGTMMFLKGSYSTSGIQEIEVKRNITVSPNPAKNQFTIETQGMKELKRVFVTDGSGKHIDLKINMVSNGSYYFESTDLSPGFYEITAIDNSGICGHAKLVIMK